MKCPICGAEVREDDKFCGECGERLRPEIAPKWKWGSMTASLVLVFFFYFLIIGETNASAELAITLLVFGFPTTIYLMYKERAGKIKYGLTWILFPILMLLFGLDAEYPENALSMFSLVAIPAIIIDVIYVYKTR
nr:hypothetical protein GZ1D1_34 [uncultured archaeon GZfos1D1]